MGSDSSKQTKEKKTQKSNFQYEPSHEVSQQKPRHNQLQDPYNERPVELSWLQQNNKNDNNNPIAHHHHHHVRHDEHLRRIPITINRWPKENEQINEKKPKSFVEEYVRV